MLNKLIFVKVADIGAHSDINQVSRRDDCLSVKILMKVVLDNRQCFTIKDLAVDGRDIMSLHIPEGPIVGHVLKHLLDKVIADGIENERDALMEEARYYVEEGSHYQFCMK